MLGKEFIKPEMSEDESPMEEVDIEREVFFELTASSGEENDEIDTKSRKSGISHRLLSDWKS